MSESQAPSPRALGGIVARGFCMGAADVVPGVSGGTMALILGIYERLLGAIRAFDVGALKLLLTGRINDAWRHVDGLFLLCLLSGIATAIVFFTRVVPLPLLITTHPEHVYGLFFGLIIGSVGLLLRELPGWRTQDWASLLTGAIAGWLVVTLVPVSTPETWWFVMIAGALAISAMILPGISGSFILLILQKYAFIFDALGRFDLTVIVPFAAGCGLGLMVFSRALHWLLGRFHQTTLVFIIGLLIASLWRIWPFQDRVYQVVRNKERLVSSTPVWPGGTELPIAMPATLMVTGLLAVILIGFMARRLSHDAR